MANQHVRYILCDRNHPDHHDLAIHDGGPLYACGSILHRTLKQALRVEKLYLKGNPESFSKEILNPLSPR